MVHIVIDGYNYINKILPLNTYNGLALETARTNFLEKLVLYKKHKPNRITVVFDAYKSLFPDRQVENYKGINVIYTRENETADEFIIKWIRKKPSGMVVVSSDRAIIDEAKRNGIAFLTPLKMEEMITGYKEDDSSVDYEYRETRKKGNPRKLPKRLRKAVRTISKIKV